MVYFVSIRDGKFGLSSQLYRSCTDVICDLNLGLTWTYLQVPESEVKSTRSRSPEFQRSP